MIFSIGQLSNKTGVKITTVRYYEKINLIPEPLRTLGNQRRYSQSSLDRLMFIKHARELGFTLDSISKLIELNTLKKKDCTEIDKIANDHLVLVRTKLNLLRKLESELTRITNGCADKQLEECYVIESLVNHDLCSDSH